MDGLGWNVGTGDEAAAWCAIVSRCDRWVAVRKAEGFPTTTACRVAAVSVTAFNDWRRRQESGPTEAEGRGTAAIVAAILQRHDGCEGMRLRSSTLPHMVDPRAYRTGTRMALAALGRGCYYPACRTPSFAWAAGEPWFALQIAHIAAAEPGGPRWDPDMTDDQRRGFANVVLLCAGHHTAVDRQPDRYPAEILHRWKQVREGAAATQLAAMSTSDAEQLLEHQAGQLVADVRAAIDQLAEISVEAAELLRDVFGDGQELVTGVDRLDTDALHLFALATDRLDIDALHQFARRATELDNTLQSYLRVAEDHTIALNRYTNEL
ncbi:MAG: hypothetical protein AB7Q92_19310 [Acidimicrobiia bacterium]